MTAQVDRSFRPDIEGLRAIAVAGVLLYHARLAGFTGGYVGVDVFFVVSGFLITRLLLNEQVRTGRVSLGAFWARRVRRLLPASLLVIAVTVIAAHWLIDPLAQKDVAFDATWSSLFSMNIALTHRGWDYLRAGLAPSPLRHYWSLSLEEQFYVVWPLVVAGLLALRRGSRTVLTWVVGAGWVISLVACGVLTSSHGTFAYYMLPTRAWELLTGAALALSAGALARVPATLRASLGWIGLGGIVASALWFTDLTRFPGWAALLPVAGTAAVIAAGGRATPDGPVLLLAWAPLQWVGERSYAIYLWHWPALVMIEAKYGPLSWWVRLAILVGAVAVSALSFALVENPVRYSARLQSSSPRSYAAGAWMIVGAIAVILTGAQTRQSLQTSDVVVPVVLATLPDRGTVLPGTDPLPVGSAPPGTSLGDTTLSGASTPGSDAQIAPPGSGSPIGPAGTADSIVTAPTPFETIPLGGTLPTAAPPGTGTPGVGNAALLAELDALIAANRQLLAASADTTKVPANLNPSLRQVRGDKPAIYDNGCILDPGQAVPKDCVFGKADGAITIVLYGDSHAAQWFPAMRTIADKQGWRLVVMTKKRCPSAAIPTVEMQKECFTWRDNVVKRIGELKPDLVMMSGYRYRAAGWAGSTSPDKAWARGLNDTLTAMRPLTKQVLVLGDTPTPVDDIPSCLAGNVRSVNRCVMTRQQAIRPGRLAAESKVAASHDAVFIPTSDWLCAPKRCPVIIGNILGYRDDSHITSAAAALLSPYLELAVRAALSA